MNIPTEYEKHIGAIQKNASCYNIRSNKKICTVVFFFTLSVGIVTPIIFSELYPATNIIFTLGILITVVLSWQDENLHQSYPWYIVLITASAVAYRLRIFLFPASMIGMDPDSYAIQMTRVIKSGDTSAITFGFYRQAPLHILEGAIMGLITALPSPTASVVYPIIGGIAIPLLTASFANRLRPDSPKTAILATGGVAVLGYTVHFSYLPIPQTLGVLFLLFTVFSIFVYFFRGRHRWLALALLTMLGTVYTHKLSAIATTLAVGGTLLIGLLHPATRNTSTVRRLVGGTVALLAILTAVQLVYVTVFSRTIILQLIVPTTLPTSPDPSVSGPSGPTAAVDPYTFTDSLFRLSYVLLLAATSGLVWLTWLLRTISENGPRRDILFLGIVAPLASSVPLLYLGDVNAARTIFYSEVLLFLLITVGWYWHTVESPTSSRQIPRYGAIGGVLLLIAIAGTSPIAGPDYNVLNRNYLTAEEVVAKEWGIETVPGEIATDQYYASETPPTRIAGLDSTIESTPKFEAHTRIYLNNNFEEEQVSTVAHRNCIENIRSGFGIWRLTYDATDVLDGSYNRVYNSGCVSYYSTVSSLSP